MSVINNCHGDTTENKDQQRLFRFHNELTPHQQDDLRRDVSDIDFSLTKRSFDLAMMPTKERLTDDDLEVVPENITASMSTSSTEQINEWELKGLELISEGAVCALLMAGGQGTRLGVTYPKGMYDVGLPSTKSLYQLQAERIVQLQRMADEAFGRQAVVPWYIMTSEHTLIPTKEFFNRNNYFGLLAENIQFFEQAMVPCLDMDGNVMLSHKWKVLRSPGGNGGIYEALQSTGMLSDMHSRGVKYAHCYGVDNILVKVADPVFVGYASTNCADCATKVVEKKDPEEKVGVVCKVGQHYRIVEYSEISQKISERRESDGRLAFKQGLICNFVFSVEFLDRICNGICDELPFHVAKKKVTCIDMESGNMWTPTTPNVVKLEKFIFDVLPYCERFLVMEVDREDEFSPVKNGLEAPNDNPDTARNAVFRLHHKLVLQAGGSVVNRDGNAIQLGAPVVCEVSPLVSYFGENLKALCEGRQFLEPVHIS